MPLKGSPDVVEQALRDAIRLAAESVRTEGTPAATLERAERLVRLEALQKQIVARRSSRRSILVVTVACSILVLAGTIRRSSIPVRGEMVVSAVTLSLPNRTVLRLGAPATRVYAAGISDVVMSGTIAGQLVAPTKSTPDEFSATRSSSNPLNIQQLTTGGPSILAIEHSAREGSIHLSLECGGACSEGEISLSGSARVDTAPGAAPIEVGPPALFQLHTASPSVDFRWWPADNAGVEVLHDFVIGSVEFLKRRDLESEELQMQSSASTLQGGQLTILGSAGRKYQLGAREGLRIRSREIRIERLRFEQTGIVVAFSAKATMLEIGIGASARNLKPTWIEWVASNQSLNLVRAALLSLVLLLVPMIGKK